MKAIRTILHKVSGKLLVSEPQESDDLYAKYNLSFGELILKQICEDASGQVVGDAVRFMEDSLQQLSSSPTIPSVSNVLIELREILRIVFVKANKFCFHEIFSVSATY